MTPTTPSRRVPSPARTANDQRKVGQPLRLASLALHTVCKGKYTYKIYYMMNVACVKVNYGVHLPRIALRDGSVALLGLGGEGGLGTHSMKPGAIVVRPFQGRWKKEEFNPGFGPVAIRVGLVERPKIKDQRAKLWNGFAGTANPWEFQTTSETVVLRLDTGVRPETRTPNMKLGACI